MLIELVVDELVGVPEYEEASAVKVLKDTEPIL